MLIYDYDYPVGMRFIVCILIFFLTASQAFACSCGYSEDHDEEVIDSADLIISGKVLEVSDPPFKYITQEELPNNASGYPLRGNFRYTKVTFEVENSYKANIDKKTIAFYVDTWTNCGKYSVARDKFIQELNEAKLIILFRVNGDYLAADKCSDVYGTEYINKILNFHYKNTESCHGTCDTNKEVAPQPFKFNPWIAFENKNELLDWINENYPVHKRQEITFKNVKFIFVTMPDGYDLYINRESEGYEIIYNVGYFEPISDEIVAEVQDNYLLIYNKTQNLIEAKFSISFLMGQACEQDPNCIDGYYCRQDDYYKPYGMCSPCADLTSENRPASCQ